MPTGDEPWSDNARTVLYSIYSLWANQSRPPSAAELGEACGLSERQLRYAFVELQAGSAMVFTDDRLQLSYTKVPPFSATPTSVAAFWEDGTFHTYLGCPAEAMTVTMLPIYDDVKLTVRSSCACCLAPITLEVSNGTVLSVSPSTTTIAISSSPWDFCSGPIDRVCDAFHFVVDSRHAKRFEEHSGRRVTEATLAQIHHVSESAARRRMRDPSWGPMRIHPRPFIRHLELNGVDVDAWK